MKKNVIASTLFILVSFVLLLCGCVHNEKDEKTVDYYDHTAGMAIEVGAAEIQLDGFPKWAAQYGRRALVEKQVSDEIVTLVSNLQLSATSDRLTDVELLELRIIDPLCSDNSEFIYIAYDYHLKSEYLYKNGEWHKTTVSDQLNQLLLQYLDDWIFCFDPCWKVQSRYRTEDFDDADLDNLIFRYNVHWKPLTPITAERHQYKAENFVNTTPMVVENEERALELAAQEMGFENPVGIVFYDKTSDYWMVELYNQKDYSNIPLEFDNLSDYTEAVNDYVSFLADNAYTVIINNSGITLETYKNITNGRQFIDFVFAEKIIHN